MNPLLTKKKLSLRARNLDVDPIKVNDKVGNPIMVGLVLVWRLKDSYTALFEIDLQIMAGIEIMEARINYLACAPEITAAVRNRQLHVYRNGKKIIILTGKAGIKVLKEECLLNDKNC